MSKIKADEISSIIKERIDNFELNADEDNNLRYARTKGKSISAVKLLSYCAVSGYMPYMGSPRRRDSLPKEEQLRKIALAQQKRERKALRKTK